MIGNQEEQQFKELNAVLADKGLNFADFLQHIDLLGKVAKKNIENESKETSGGKIFLDKEFLYPHTQDVYIYRDNRTKTKGYYIRIWDRKLKKHFTKSLKTTSREIAVYQANEIYTTRKGRLGIGVRHSSITSTELVARYQQLRRKEISNKTHVGITKESYRAMCDRLRYWEYYTEELGYKNTKIEDIPVEVGSKFAMWIKERRKVRYTSKGARSNQTINHIIAAVKRMYMKVAIDEKYITYNELPQFTYLKKERERSPRRDIITSDEFTRVSDWLRYKYPFMKDRDGNKPSEKEQIKRRIYAVTHTIHYYTGCRTKELLNIKWSDISDVDRNKKGFGIDKVIHISSETAKTGRSRNIVAPIANQLNTLIKWYGRFGHNVNTNSDEYVFLKMTNTAIGNNEPMTDVAMSKRIKVVYDNAEKDGYLTLNGRNITNYSNRHSHITDRLLNGVDIYQIALNCGTSVQYIEETYSHLTTMMKSDELTTQLGAHRKLAYEDYMHKEIKA